MKFRTIKLAVIISMIICTLHTINAQDIDLELGSLAPGKSITIKYKVEVNLLFGGSSVANQGNVSGLNFADVLTDDPDVGGATDPTITPIVQPAVPVELVSFLSTIDKNNVELHWETATEVNNYGFEVERSDGKTESGENNFHKIGFVAGAGNSNSPKNYMFKDKNLRNGNYSYRLKQIDTDGSYEYFTKIEIEINAVPEEYALQQNYPNPFNPTTKIEYNLPFESKIIIKAYNILGEHVVTLADDVKSAGFYKVEWDARNNPSGTYIYTLEASPVDGKDAFKTFRKMILVK